MTPCPTCGYAIDAATLLNYGDARPAAGDLSLCLNCGALLIFDGPDVNAIRRITPEEEAVLDDANRMAVDRAQAVIRERGRFR